MNWRKSSIKGFKLKSPKNQPALPVRHSTDHRSTVPMWLFTLMVVFALFTGAWTAFNMMTMDVYATCAKTGEWTWNSFILTPAKPIKCVVDSSMNK